MKKLALLALLLVACNAFAYKTDEYCVSDVIGQYKKLGPNGVDLVMGDGGQFKGRTYTQALVNSFGHDNHFQGAVRLQNSNFFVFSGADYMRKHSNLFVAELASEPRESAWVKNFKGQFPVPPKEDRVILNITIGDSAYWHAGGISRLGDLVVVPLEEFKGTRRSKVIFFDFSNPRKPRQLNSSIIRPTRGAGGAGIFKLKDGRIAVGVYTGGTYDFYFSKTSDVEDGFDVNFTHWDESQNVANPAVKYNVGGSSFDIVQQCDGRLFFFAPENDADLAPVTKGKDYAHLYTLDFDENLNPKMYQIGDRILNCNGFCNFAGSVGVYVDSDHKMSIQGPNFFRNWVGNKIRLKEFTVQN